MRLASGKCWQNRQVKKRPAVATHADSQVMLTRCLKSINSRLPTKGNGCSFSTFSKQKHGVDIGRLYLPITIFYVFNVSILISLPIAEVCKSASKHDCPNI